MSKARAEWTRLPERSSLVWLSVMRWLALRLGRRVARCLLHPIALYFLFTGGPACAASRAYLTRVFGRPPRLSERLRHLHCFAATVLDRVYLLNDRDTLFDIEIEGREVIDRVMARGEGVFLLGAHLGSFEVLRTAGRWYSGLRVAMVMYPDNARKINAVLAAINPGLVSEIVPIGQIDSMFTVKSRLDEGCLVGMMGDRGVGGEAKAVCPFLGEPASFPLGPLRLAALMRRPVLFMTGIYLGGNRYRLHFSELADFSALAGAGRNTALQAGLAAYVTQLEAQCRAAPYNWFNFFDFWADNAG
ncbi:Lipid A biosynthesis lauroyltransferase [Pandoraea terrae]|uniref:Lipid A biosynthesis lauroyltransferase n=1 Tax=Pandoraea terrae TaxID=1537710 RepID=A0A5E4S7Q1_9BURK|nr:acyl-CoA synthetase [Pandoraea terrae]VVD71231.1 Lipid A biosynthesis lauroyltransferase [Pandoraea terrae]